MFWDDYNNWLQWGQTVKLLFGRYSFGLKSLITEINLSETGEVM